MTIGNVQESRGRKTIRLERGALPLGRLERWMRDHVGEFCGPLSAERFEGVPITADQAACRRRGSVSPSAECRLSPPS